MIECSVCELSEFYGAYRVWGDARDSEVMYKRAKELEKGRAELCLK